MFGKSLPSKVKSIFLLNTQIKGDILCRVGALSSEEVSLGKIGQRWIYRGSLFSNHREDYSRKRRHGSQNTSFRLPSWVDAIVLFKLLKAWNGTKVTLH
jgi:hypothetical protein